MRSTWARRSAGAACSAVNALCLRSWRTLFTAALPSARARRRPCSPGAASRCALPVVARSCARRAAMSSNWRASMASSASVIRRATSLSCPVRRRGPATRGSGCRPGQAVGGARCDQRGHRRTIARRIGGRGGFEASGNALEGASPEIAAPGRPCRDAGARASATRPGSCTVRSPCRSSRWMRATPTTNATMKRFSETWARHGDITTRRT